MRHGRRPVHPGSLDSPGCALVFLWFVRGRWVQVASWVVSSGVCVFSVVRPGGNLVQLCTLGSLQCALGIVRAAGFTGVRHGGRWFHKGSLGSLRSAQVAVEFIQVH